MRLQPVAVIHTVVRERTNWPAFLFVRVTVSKQFGVDKAGTARRSAILRWTARSGVVLFVSL